MPKPHRFTTYTEADQVGRTAISRIPSYPPGPDWTYRVLRHPSGGYTAQLWPSGRYLDKQGRIMLDC